jgi:pimeloyl-ACP methyl ester carboxylesterase
MTELKKTPLFAETLGLAVADLGQGPAVLLLHGGAGPGSMMGLATALSSQFRVIVPTHPGFQGEDRPGWFTRVDDLVLTYLTLLERLGVTDVVVVGNSFGGWIAAEMALRHSPRVARLVLLNAVGIDPGEGKPIVDPMLVPPTDRAALSFHNPGKFAVAPSPAQLAVMAANQTAMRVYAGEALHDPALRPRLAGITVPTLVAWGASDQIVDQAYGRLFAASIPGARFTLVTEAGHFPQVEQPVAVVALLTGAPMA